MTPNGNGELDAVYDNDLPKGAPPRRSRRGLVILLLVVILLAIAVYSGIHGRIEAEHVLAQTTEASAVPTVSAVHPDVGAPNEELVLPGSTQAITDTPIYARTAGYLKRWTSDIGAHVKKGDLLAEIDTPEVDEQLRQMRADLETAQANLKLADLTAKRNEDLLKTRSIATQERDNAVGAQAAAKANVASKQADVARLERMQSYEKVYAPFDGIITARNTDIGALIDAGANSAARELFHLSAIDRIRVFVSVPEAYSRAVHPGDKAKVTLDEFPGEAFQGILARTSNAIDPASRSLLVEIDVDNADGRLLPGAYAFVHLSLAKPMKSVTLPSNALIFRKEGIRVAVIHDGKADLVPIVIGRDYGDRIEVVSGLQATDDVILDPSDSLITGTAVRTEAPAPVGAPK
ncbi:MAG TPA: efflux RND transporter periplasmic adaptor subunit [Aliidongia sp.]|uniref:efflux RND transporter periplasmic adaptor subunit n=1 Tax=Aliidongia sp. TaxID=1914230 RepID=UPI002DDD9EA2|nr:efflux RND transporter periplasmic adaptor subunit [Aliidongia sp.]HEV2678794.1 efflux RND transporter periplasmic adaptor subunit [Aliidongia sp.]